MCNDDSLLGEKLYLYNITLKFKVCSGFNPTRDPPRTFMERSRPHPL